MIKKMKIIELSEQPELLDKAVNYFWESWGNESNYDFYKDCIVHSLLSSDQLPKFFLVLDNEEIVASYALLTNDIISRQDLLPWFACLFVNDSHRNQGIASRLLDHSRSEAKKLGYENLYLSTDLENFYEKKNWQFFATGYSIDGTPFKIYSIKSTL